MTFNYIGIKIMQAVIYYNIDTLVRVNVPIIFDAMYPGQIFRFWGKQYTKVLDLNIYYNYGFY